MKSDSCPNSEELRAFVRCNLSEPEADSISAHLEQCRACEETVVGLERDGDTIGDRIKQAAAEQTFAHEPECQQLMQSLLEASGTGSPESSGHAEAFPVSRNVRDYQIVAKLGEGGMGTVYKAVHQRLKKTVALKVLPTSRIGDRPAVARFEREMEVLGQLNHPHIVQALDAGEHDGQHYLVMEYVEGCDLSDIVKRCSPLSIADACLMISQAAEGLQYAHEHSFVHRDIKPSNLMLAMTGAKSGTPAIVKILDLGLARALDQRADAASPKTELTTTGQVMGTPDYMAPEQGDDSHQVDIRADIYSLGATLYKLLTGQSPYAEFETLSPMRRLMAIAKHEPPAIRSKRPDIPEKLAAIIHRMLAKQPERRFATPTQVVEALAPFCVGANLSALVVPSGVTQVLDTKTHATTPLAASAAGQGGGQRRRTTLAGFAAFLALAAVIVIATRNGTVEVTAPDGELPDDVTIVVSRGGEEVEVLQADNKWSAKIVNGEYKVELRGGEDRFDIEDSKLTVSRMGRAVVTVKRRPAVASKTGAAAVTLKAIAIPAEPRASPRRKAQRRNVTLKAIAIPAEPRDIDPRQSLSSLALSQHPESIAEVQSWTVETARHRGPIYSLAYRPDSSLIATAGEDGSVRLTDVETGRLRKVLLGHSLPVRGVCWSPDGKYLASAGDDATIRFWDPDNGQLLRTISGKGHAIHAIAWSPDGKMIAAGGDDKSVVLRDVSSGQTVEELTGSTKPVRCLAWSSDGRWLAWGSDDKSIHVWDAIAKQAVSAMPLMAAGGVLAIAWSPNGESLASVGGKTIELWNRSSWQRDDENTLQSPQNFSSLSWSPDGNHLAVGGSYAELFTNRLEPKGRLSSGISSSAVAFAPNGATVAAAGWEIAIWDAKSRSPLNVQESVGFSDGWLDWSADAGTLAFGMPHRHTWMFWRSNDSHKVRTAGGQQLALSPSAPLFAIENKNERTVRICDANTLEQRHLLDGYYDMYSIQMAWHPRETILASVQSTTSIRLTNAESGETIKVLSKEAADPFGTARLVWAPTGRALCSVGSDVAYLWETETGKPTQVLNHPKNQQVTAVAWSSDGKTLATGCRDSVIRLWDVETGRTKDVLRGHVAPVLEVAWLDEQTLASVGADAKTVVWDTAKGTKTSFDSPYLKLHVFNGIFWKMARFSPNGEILATSSDHAIRFQNVRTGTHRGSLVVVPSEPPLPIAISSEGHYDGPQGAIRELVYVVQTAAGQATLSPSEFAKKYGFENNPGRVHLTQ